MGFEGDRVAYEHIYWDQATVLVQLGLIDPAGFPIAGAEQADRLIEDGGGQPVAEMLPAWSRWGTWTESGVEGGGPQKLGAVRTLVKKALPPPRGCGRLAGLGDGLLRLPLLLPRLLDLRLLA